MRAVIVAIVFLLVALLLGCKREYRSTERILPTRTIAVTNEKTAIRATVTRTIGMTNAIPIELERDGETFSLTFPPNIICKDMVSADNASVVFLLLAEVSVRKKDENRGNIVESYNAKGIEILNLPSSSLPLSDVSRNRLFNMDALQGDGRVFVSDILSSSADGKILNLKCAVSEQISDGVTEWTYHEYSYAIGSGVLHPTDKSLSVLKLSPPNPAEDKKDGKGEKASRQSE